MEVYLAQIENAVEAGYNDIRLYDTSPIASGICDTDFNPSLLTITYTTQNDKKYPSRDVITEFDSRVMHDELKTWSRGGNNLLNIQ